MKRGKSRRPNQQRRQQPAAKRRRPARPQPRRRSKAIDRDQAAVDHVNRATPRIHSQVVDREAADHASDRAHTSATTAPAAAKGLFDFPVVGIGASAGGLEACSQVLRAIPMDIDFAIVIVQHMAPEH